MAAGPTGGRRRTREGANVLINFMLEASSRPNFMLEASSRGWVERDTGSYVATTVGLGVCRLCVLKTRFPCEHDGRRQVLATVEPFP